ncbi:MAG: exodeoxyribonuclease V subunit gamma [Burkholderiaceae bacterium]|nr:exodeoxyribonuclease V subunit gamma [Burkholderiaceae bacterium]
MLRLRFDHRLERLADALLDSFDDAGPFDERVVVVPSTGTGRWLQQRDAQRHGVSARLRPEFAGRWLWNTMRAVLDRLPAQSPFDPERVRWHLLALLDELPDELPEGDDFALLRKRLGERGSIARLSAADAVARAFERYLAYRRDWLARWQRGQWAGGEAALDVHEPWQRWLWNRLLERLPGVRDEHPYDAFARVLAEGDAAQLERALGGRRVAIFGRVDLSPEQFALFGRLAGSIDVSIFAPDPCRELWSDLLDPASLARVRAQRPDEAWLYDGEPSILGSWGRAHRDFVAQLLDLEERFGVQAEAPGRDEPLPFDSRDTRGDAPTALQALHASVFLRSDAPWRALRGLDDSIRIVGTHGPVREAEILHEILLECFATMPGLAPADVVVHCADIETAAPAIAGVFESVPAERRIPLAISGRLRGIDPAIDAVEAIVGAAVHGIDAARLDALLRNPALAEALSLDESEVDALLDGLARAGARRGLDAHDGASKHNLQAATDRLLLGAAIGVEQVCGDLLAVPGAQGTRARALDGWLALAEALGRLRALASRPRPPREWCEALGDVVETIFARSRAQAAVQRVREAIDRLAASGDEAAGVVLDAAAFARAFADAIAQGAPAVVPGGAVTVVPIGSLRGVPYRVVCLFGFDERSFPRRGARDEIDLMRHAPRFGDRLVRNDDRGAFLDAVLAARERLVVSCRSRDARDDSPLNPSPLVVELLAWLSARLGDDARAAPASIPRVRRGEAGSGPALVEYPLHPFSRRNFEGEHADRASEWLATAQAASAPLASRAEAIGALFDVDAAPGGPSDSAPDSAPDDAIGAQNADDYAHAAQPHAFPEADAIVPIERLRRALSDPARTWLAESLVATLPADDDEPPEHEPLWPQSARDARQIQRCVERLLAGEERARLVRELQCSPATPAGAAGAIDAEAAVAQAQSLIERALDARTSIGAPAAEPDAQLAPRRSEPVVARVGALRLGMSPPALDSQGRLLFVSAYPLGPHSLIDAWLRTALWRFAVDSAATGRLITPDQTIVVNCDYALRALEHAIEWSRRISTQPLALFPRSWLCHARELMRGKGRERVALERAQAVLAGDDSGFRTPELAQPAMRALYRDAGIDFERVLPLCDRVYRPIFDDTSLAGSAEAEGAAP